LPTLRSSSGYKKQFNWPYDFVSFVETIQFGTEILYKPGAKGIDGSTLEQAGIRTRAIGDESKTTIIDRANRSPSTTSPTRSGANTYLRSETATTTSPTRSDANTYLRSETATTTSPTRSGANTYLRSEATATTIETLEEPFETSELASGILQGRGGGTKGGY